MLIIQLILLGKLIIHRWMSSEQAATYLRLQATNNNNTTLIACPHKWATLLISSTLSQWVSTVWTRMKRTREMTMEWWIQFCSQISKLVKTTLAPPNRGPSASAARRTQSSPTTPRPPTGPRAGAGSDSESQPHLKITIKSPKLSRNAKASLSLITNIVNLKFKMLQQYNNQQH